MKKLLLAGIAASTLVSAVPVGAGASTGDHWCRHGDPPILASAHTSCPFADKIVSAWFSKSCTSRCQGLVRSPTTHKTYSITCKLAGSRYTGSIRCHDNSGRGIRVRFTTHA
jgi:hypothetical protein